MPGSLSRSRASLWGGILLLAVVARVAGVALVDLSRFPAANSEHWSHAVNMYRGLGFSFNWYGLYQAPVVGSFLPPLFSWILWLALSLAGGSMRGAVLLTQAVNIALGTVTVYLTGRLAGMARPDLPATAADPPGGTAWHRRILRDPELLGGVIWAVYPPALGHAAEPQSQTAETFLLVLLVFLVARALGARTVRPGAGAGAGAGLTAGLVLGLSLLARPTVAVAWALWGAYLLWRSSRRSAVLRFFVLATVAAALVVTPWTVRNWRVHHRLVPIATNGGFNFYLGNNPDTGGGIPPLNLFFIRMPESEQETWRGLGEVGRDRRFYALGLAFWREHPGRALQGVGHKLFDFVLFRPYLFAAYPRWVALLLVVCYVPLLVAFLPAIPRARGETSALCLLTIASTALMGCVYVVSMRFRATVEPLLVAVVSAYPPFRAPLPGEPSSRFPCPGKSPLPRPAGPTRASPTLYAP